MKIYETKDYYENGYVTTPEIDTDYLLISGIMLPLLPMAVMLLIYGV